LQVRLEDQAIEIAMAALDAVTIPVIVCQGDGRISHLSASGDAALRSERFLAVRRGRLCAVEPGSDALLQANLRLAAMRSAKASDPLPEPVALRSKDGLECMIADVAAFQTPHLFQRGRRVLVILRERPLRDKKLELEHLGLSPTEAQIARALARGESPMEIAERRCVSLATVRTQTQAIYRKLGVRRQLELAAKLSQFG
jgi:DNA-binding CsgD family transcriptional regulator